MSMSAGTGDTTSSFLTVFEDELIFLDFKSPNFDLKSNYLSKNIFTTEMELRERRRTLFAFFYAVSVCSLTLSVCNAAEVVTGEGI